MKGSQKVRGEGTTFASLLVNYPEEMTGGNGFDMLVKILDSAVDAGPNSS